MKNILNRGFSEMTLADFIVLVKFIIAQLTGNAFFPSTDPKSATSMPS